MTQGHETRQAAGGVGRWLPGVLTLRAYQRSWLPRDVVAGIVLTALLVPAGMGYAEASGLPAIYGLYATIVPLVAYAPGSPASGSSPTCCPSPSATAT
jgi:MFS superfamily sulfate permease-like transporter